MITARQLDALRFYSEVYGRNWRQVLRADWVAGTLDNLDLKALREAKGPHWLESFSFRRT